MSMLENERVETGIEDAAVNLTKGPEPASGDFQPSSGAEQPRPSADNPGHYVSETLKAAEIYNRTAGTYRRIAKLMAELGWTAVRVRDLTRGGYKEQVRGYVRDARHSNIGEKR